MVVFQTSEESSNLAVLAVLVWWGLSDIRGVFLHLQYIISYDCSEPEPIFKCVTDL